MSRVFSVTKYNHLCIVSTFIITFIFRQFKTAEDVPAPYKSDTKVLLGNKSLFTYFHSWYNNGIFTTTSEMDQFEIHISIYLQQILLIELKITTYTHKYFSELFFVTTLMTDLKEIFMYRFRFILNNCLALCECSILTFHFATASARSSKNNRHSYCEA